jgi:hypothetical protein
VVASNQLDRAMIVSHDERWRLDLRSGVPLREPASPTDAPSAAMIRYH